MNHMSDALHDTVRRELLKQSREARDEGLARAHDNVVTAPWKVVAYDALVELARTGQPFTAEDLRGVVGDPPTTKIMGAVFNTAARRGIIHRVGVTQATRVEAHAGLRSVWEGSETDPTAEDLIEGPPEPITIERWKCLACGHVYPYPPGESALGGWRVGKCQGCGLDSTFGRM